MVVGLGQGSSLERVDGVSYLLKVQLQKNLEGFMYRVNPGVRRSCGCGCVTAVGNVTAGGGAPAVHLRRE